jgi:hypothetical protein
MNSKPIEIYHPRTVSHLGLWDMASLQFKIYGLVADNRRIDQAMLSLAQSFVQAEVLPRVADEGDDNGMGFVIIHPGESGVTVSAHWWIQASVLCQHNYRKPYAAAQPLDTVKRPVIGCIWELALIHAEQEAWRRTMMKAEPNPSGYMTSRADFDAA